MRKAFSVTLAEAEHPSDFDLWPEEDELRVDDLVDTLPIQRVSCFAHSLQLVVKDGLKDRKPYDAAISRCTRMCTLLHSSLSFKVYII